MKKQITLIIVIIAVLMIPAAIFSFKPFKSEKIAIWGCITDIDSQTNYIVAEIEGKEEADTLFDKASVKITEKTEIRNAENKKIGAENLKNWNFVEISFSDQTIENYNVKGIAKTIKVLEKKDLTIEDLEALAEKGDELSWVDFLPYKSEDIGSGLCILQFNISDKFTLLVGGIPYEKPLYISLSNKKGNDKIDIRTDDVSSFVAKWKNQN